MRRNALALISYLGLLCGLAMASMAPFLFIGSGLNIEPQHDDAVWWYRRIAVTMGGAGLLLIRWALKVRSKGWD